MQLRRRIFGNAMLAAALMLAVTSARADTLLVHGHIYTGNPQAPWAEALLVRDGRIVAVGTDREVKKLQHTSDSVLDVHGQTVIFEGELASS